MKLNDTLISNMDNKDKKYVAQAIKLNKFEEIIIIDDIAILSTDEIDPSMFSLHIYEQIDLISFWNSFDQLRDNRKNKIMTMNDMLREAVNNI